jgi:ribosomal protein L32
MQHEKIAAARYQTWSAANMTTNPLIKCPACGHRHLPAEVDRNAFDTLIDLCTAYRVRPTPTRELHLTKDQAAELLRLLGQLPADLDGITVSRLKELLEGDLLAADELVEEGDTNIPSGSRVGGA